MENPSDFDNYLSFMEHFCSVGVCIFLFSPSHNCTMGRIVFGQDLVLIRQTCSGELLSGFLVLAWRFATSFGIVLNFSTVSRHIHVRVEHGAEVAAAVIVAADWNPNESNVVIHRVSVIVGMLNDVQYRVFDLSAL